MSYNSLYRRMRPKTFDQIIGQDHITTALRNQVKSGTLGHAYLFSGTRGTGKTSTALVLAKAVNCLNPRDGNPCLTCENCTIEHSLDIIEMDAASNNSVEDIRDLREHVKFAPSAGRKKIYIIDEVHMLSQGAFNALLKTLEEPPEYVMFILATTETHKVPMTIQSRCQKFEFKRIPPLGIRSLLRQIVADLDADLSEDAMSAIIANSDGALRDSLAALEQVMSVSGRRIEEDDVHRVLGTVPQEDMLRLIGAALTANHPDILDEVEHIASQGKDFVQILSGLIDTVRNVLVAALVGNAQTPLIQASDAYRAELERLSATISVSDARQLFDSLVALSQHLRYSRNKRALVEVVLLRSSLLSTQPVTMPIAQSTAQSAEQPIAQPVEQPIPKPLEQPIAQPVARPILKPAAKSMTTPAEKQPSKSVNPASMNAASVSTVKPIEKKGDEELWGELLEQLKVANPAGWNLVRHSRVLLRSDDSIKIGVENLNKLAQSALHFEMKGEIERLFHELAGEQCSFEFERIEISQQTMQLEIEQVKSYFEKSGETVDVIGDDSES